MISVEHLSKCAIWPRTRLAQISLQSYLTREDVATRLSTVEAAIRRVQADDQEPPEEVKQWVEALRLTLQDYDRRQQNGS